MKEQLTKILETIKEFWQKLSPKVKKAVLITGAALLVVAIGLTVFLNLRNLGYRVLYNNMSAAESAEVYATLQDMGVTPKLSSSGQVMVPSEEWDRAVFELAAKGLPKGTLVYDVFDSRMGFTTTEFERRQSLVFLIQNRLQDTLARISPIESAEVTINIPENSNYVWNQSTQEESSAGVTVHLTQGKELNAGQVTAIRNLVAAAVPKLQAENVVVIDGATGVDLSDPSSYHDDLYGVKRLEFERLVAKGIEDNVKRLLTPRYGVDGVTVVAAVELDYDKMLTERKEWVPEDDGHGVENHLYETYGINGQVPVSGLVGEEDNTDIPQYANQTGDTEGGMTNYTREINYEISYILTQIEKGEAVLKNASVSAIVNDPDFTVEKEELLVQLIAKSTNVMATNVKVTNLDFTAPTQPGVNPNPGLFTRDMLVILIGGLALITLLVILMAILMHRSKKKKLAAQAALEEAQAQTISNAQLEVEQHKQQLMEEAQAASQTKESAITEEIRNFAKENPEITANLIRSLLKEE